MTCPHLSSNAGKEGVQEELLCANVQVRGHGVLEEGGCDEG